MKNFRIISRLEVKTNYVIKGLRMDGLKKIDIPENIIKKFDDNYIDEIFYDDVVASLYDRPVDLNIVKTISQIINIPFAVSGRVKKISDFYGLFRAGADKVSLNTINFEKPELLKKASKIFGSQSVCAHIQYKKIHPDQKTPEVFSESGRERKNHKLFDWVEFVQDCGAGEIYLFSIDNDGIDYPLDLEILKKVRKIAHVPLIYGGGINSVDKIKKIIDLGLDGVTVSSALYDKSLDPHLAKIELAKIYNKISFNTK
jgi:imidazole glycerol-phosphate synthase subunit HisF